MNRGVTSCSPVWRDGIMLQAVWQVDRGTDYQVSRNSSAPTWILVRTLAGCGRLELTESAGFGADAGTILLLDNRKLRHYGTAGTRWRFDWFEFGSTAPMLKPETLFQLADDHFETEVREQLAFLLRQQDEVRAAAAAALLGWLMNWYAAAVGASLPRRDRRIDAAIETMGRQLDRPLAIGELARRQGMCDRSFRSLFRRETGMSPKAFHNRLRLKLAEELLASGECNVEQAADRLGFSSPFHFSSAFKRCFGIPPSRCRETPHPESGPDGGVK